MRMVEVYNEWDPLEEIIIGTAQFAKLPRHDLGFEKIVAQEVFGNYEPNYFPQKLIDETEEDLDILINALRKMGVVVKQPKPHDFKDTFKTPNWEANSFFCYCPRDVLLAIGDTIIETPNVFRSRYFETDAYKSILLDYMRHGAKWISAPKPELLDEIYSDFSSEKLVLNDLEPAFDAANIIRAGKDLFYLVSLTGNELGCQWLQNVLGSEYKVHACRNLYTSAHIDTTIVLLRPGLALINPARVTENNLPPLLKKWDLLVAPEMVSYQYSDVTPMSTPWLGMNLLMINPHLAVVDQHQVALIKLLEKHKIDVLPLQLRHGRALGGGFHCVSLDVRRKGKLENYF